LIVWSSNLYSQFCTSSPYKMSRLLINNIFPYFSKGVQRYGNCVIRK
jgi:hypothetical protein